MKTFKQAMKDIGPREVRRRKAAIKREQRRRAAADGKVLYWAVGGPYGGNWLCVSRGTGTAHFCVGGRCGRYVPEGVNLVWKECKHLTYLEK